MNQHDALSRNGVAIRLPDKRWQHIMEDHVELDGLRNEVLKTIADAERVLRGSGGELLAVRSIEPGKVLVVIYREIDAEDGFVITAFVTRRLQSLDRRTQLWPPRA